MKTSLKVTALAVLLVAAPRTCFALWSIASVSKDQAKELGMEVRAEPAGPDNVRVELEFKIEGALENFSRVDLRVGEGDELVVASLQQDRSQPGRVVVSFSAHRTQLDKTMLWVMVPESLGGTAYEVRVKDFVESEKGP